MATASNREESLRPLHEKKSTWIWQSVAVLALSVLAYLYYFKPRTEGMDDSVPFKVVELPGRGKGMIATRRIEQGELLLREEPLFLVPPTTNESPTSIIANLVASLSPSARTAFFALAHHDTTLPPPAIPLAIFETNAINAGEDGIGIFPRTARLNHGCSSAFNAVYSWRHRENALVVHAIRRIEKGQELLTTYTDTKRPRRERRAFTSESYGFKCQCAVCTLPPALSAASDARLEKLTQLKARFTTWGSGAISGAVAIGLAREMWAVGEEEGYISERGQLAADAAHVAAAHKDEEATRLWAQLAVKWYGIELGIDSEQVARMKAVAASPRSHAVWGLRGKEVVGGPSKLGGLR